MHLVRCGDGYGRVEMIIGYIGSRDIDRIRLQFGGTGNYTGSISPISFGLSMGHERKRNHPCSFHPCTVDWIDSSPESSGNIGCGWPHSLRRVKTRWEMGKTTYLRCFGVYLIPIPSSFLCLSKRNECLDVPNGAYDRWEKKEKKKRERMQTEQKIWKNNEIELWRLGW